MQPAGEPVLGCLETQSKVEFSDTPIQSEGVDPLPMEVTSHNFANGDATQLQPLVFSTEAALPTHEPSQGPFSQSLGAPSVASEGAPGATCQAGPTRAVLECFAGQAQLASSLIKQGYFSYGVDRVKQKSAMAPVLQMDLSSRTACDLILTWLDQQKVAGVMICVPKHALEQLTTAFVYSVIVGCVVRDLPLVLEGSVISRLLRCIERRLRCLWTRSFCRGLRQGGT